MIYEVLKECLFLLNKMSVYLLFGFLVAGIIHIFIKEEFIAKHLGKHNLGSVIKASLFGIPLPLCSCSVVPTALSLKRDGASKGSILSFLISTPTTGIDSIFATYSLLGGLFTVFRIIASFIAGVLAGIISVTFDNANEKNISRNEPNSKKTCCHHHGEGAKQRTIMQKFFEALRYAFVDLLEEISGWLVIGILIGGVISYFIPETFIAKYLGSLWQSIFVMMIIGIPMYVCSSGSLPIAAALMLKGLNPAAAFVFLFVGPATNSAALTLVFKELGFKSVIIFLFSIVFVSVSLGLLLNSIWVSLDLNIATHLMTRSGTIPSWLEVSSSVILIVLIVFNLIRNILKGHAR